MIFLTISYERPIIASNPAIKMEDKLNSGFHLEELCM
jgi:hypothetical protein